MLILVGGGNDEVPRVHPALKATMRGAGSMRILLVEDEQSLAGALATALEHEAYAVDLADDGRSADELMYTNDYDLVVLDWTIPAPTGIELLGRWRSAGNQMPVLMLTGRATVEDRVNGLDAGADDYMTKPFLLNEFMARVRSLLRRRDKEFHQTLIAGDLEMNRTPHRVEVGGVDTDLSPKEFAMLEYFIIRLDQVERKARTAHLVLWCFSDFIVFVRNPVRWLRSRRRRRAIGWRGRG